MPIHVSNVALIDPIDKKPTRTTFISVKEPNGSIRRARVSVRTGYEIPLPILPKRTRLGNN